MADIEELGRRVAEARGPDRELDARLDCVLTNTSFDAMIRDGWAVGDFEAPAYSGSIDAALALVERMLPGWGCQIAVPAEGGTQHPRVGVHLWPPGGNGIGGYGPTAPIAIISALLKALSSIRPNGGAEE